MEHLEKSLFSDDDSSISGGSAPSLITATGVSRPPIQPQRGSGLGSEDGESRGSSIFMPTLETNQALVVEDIPVPNPNPNPNVEAGSKVGRADVLNVGDRYTLALPKPMRETTVADIPTAPGPDLSFQDVFDVAAYGASPMMVDVLHQLEASAHLDPDLVQMEFDLESFLSAHQEPSVPNIPVVSGSSSAPTQIKKAIKKNTGLQLSATQKAQRRHKNPGDIVIKSQPRSVKAPKSDPKAPQAPCPVCGKILSAKTANMKRHMAKHEGATYHCPVCGLQLADMSVVRRHVKRIHPDHKL